MPDHKGGFTPRYAEHENEMTYIRDVQKMVATVCVNECE
jgi:hypothetical protein